MAKIRLGDYCCQGGDKIIDQNDFEPDDIVITSRGNNSLLFSPLGNHPKNPLLALVGITPGSQSEVFADLLRFNTVEEAASMAAFAKGQDAIKALLKAHNFADSIGLNLDGDLNTNPSLFTTSLVKCCLKVDGNYKYKAPDIAASPEASYCLSNRFVGDIESFPSLKWIVIFGDSGWEAVNSIQHHGASVRRYLESKGLVVLNFPHFAQNFQQRAIFVLKENEEQRYFEQKPSHIAYAPAAQKMRAAVLEAIGNQNQKSNEHNLNETKQKSAANTDRVPKTKGNTNKVKTSSRTSSDLFSNLFYLLHQSGDKLYPVKIKNRDTGKVSFRVSKGGAGGNTKESGIEIEDEYKMKKYVLEQGYAVRAATTSKSRNGLFKIGQRSIVRAVEEN